MRFAAIDEFDVLISDSGLAETDRRALEEVDIEVVLREGMRRMRVVTTTLAVGEGPQRIWRSQREGRARMSTVIPAPTGAATGGWRARVQKFGGFLAGMVIPNIAAFIAWGLITAFFIQTGWTPNADSAELVGPMIFFLLPNLIGYTGGYLVHGQRGAVVGAVATAGVAIGGFIGTVVDGEVVQTPMFLGAIVMGPLGGWLVPSNSTRR